MVGLLNHRFLAAAIAVVFLGAGPLSAKQQEGTASAAAAHFAMATRLFEAGHYSAAIDSFERAYRLRPHFRVQCSIARARENLGQVRKAITHYRRCLSEGAETSPIAARIRGSIEDLQRRPSQTEATEQGAKGAVPENRPSLVPSSRPVAEDPPEAEEQPSGSKRRLGSKWFWIAAGTTAALTVTAAVLGAQTAGLKSDYDSDPTRSGYQSFVDRRLATNVFAVAAVLAGGSSLVLFYLTDFGSTDRAAPKAAMVGVSLRGTF